MNGRTVGLYRVAGLRLDLKIYRWIDIPNVPFQSWVALAISSPTFLGERPDERKGEKLNFLSQCERRATETRWKRRKFNNSISTFRLIDRRGPKAIASLNRGRYCSTYMIVTRWLTQSLSRGLIPSELTYHPLYTRSLTQRSDLGSEGGSGSDFTSNSSEADDLDFTGIEFRRHFISLFTSLSSKI